jgi:predicted porin
VKKRIIPLIAVGVLTVSPTSYAQSSVTLYGKLDAGLGFVKTNTGNQYGLFAGGMFGDRWGFKGSEDLGGGLAAVFLLENGFSLANGQLKQGGREFGRQAFVGLTDQKYGSLLLGRQYDPTVEMVQGLTADPTFGSSFATPGDIDNYDNSVRISNSIKYVTPTYNGLSFEALYGFGGVAGASGQGQVWSGAARYVAGPVSFAVGYLNSRNANGTSIRSSWTSSTADSFFSSPINNGYQTANSYSIARAAGQYALGKLTTSVSYSNVQAKHDGLSTFASDEHWNVGTVYSKYQLTHAALIGVGYTYTHASGDTSATYHQVNIGTTYSLSRRTDLYVIAGYQHANGVQRTVTGGIRQAQASIGAYGIAGSKTQELAVTGIVHRF